MSFLVNRFESRLRSIYSSQKRRAIKHGTTIPYTVDELIAHCTPKFADGCPYCGEHMTPAVFQIDHIRPLKREGGWTLANVQPVCTPCNRRKGALLDSEYRRLLDFVATFEPFPRMNILSRLAAGGAWLGNKFS